uniref:7-cyano-7-deazaguanine synthase (Queuosine biosynthesis) n=1 Tax=Candidatus Kentrum sp. TC TaxID=2126339 RepID=A0A451A2T4_9GAMM|nr:MAG: hypothetical protein BECKTC1821F_GA0114240_10456 [Candidatus Kentron sp. TC]
MHQTKIEVRISAKRSMSSESQSVSCVVGKDVHIDYGFLEDSLFKNVGDREFDVFTLIGTVEFADRRFRRLLGKGWAREFSLRVPVASPEFWNRKLVGGILAETLHFLTGDQWEFRFERRHRDVPRKVQPGLSFERKGPFHVLPYSDGMDSCILEQLSRHRNPWVQQLRVTAWNQSLSAEKKFDHDGGGFRIPIPIRSEIGTHPELTFRTRPFKFLMLCALAAKSTESSRILIPENGQGILSPVLTPKGAEWIYWGVHPAFTTRLRRFIENALGYSVAFEHPHIWRTKGRMLTELLSINGQWQSTRSCSSNPRHGILIDGKRVHCGICANCLLRRLSLHTAGVGADAEPYVWQHLDAASFEGALHRNAPRRNHNRRKYYFDVAVNAIFAADDFASLLDLANGNDAIDRHAYQLDALGYCPREEARENIRNLIRTHKEEWESFLASLPAHSWVRKVVG